MNRNIYYVRGGKCDFKKSNLAQIFLLGDLNLLPVMDIGCHLLLERKDNYGLEIDFSIIKNKNEVPKITSFLNL